jgi:glycosyltransferase involved in cell wall biosynthesis
MRRRWRRAQSASLENCGFIHLLLSIVIPVYNGEKDLRSCLEHVLASGAGGFECIVVDDGSTDGSADIARELGATVVAAGRRRGPAHARNLGARAAKGEIVVFVDADVWVRPDTLERIRGHFLRDPALSAVFGCYDDEPLHGNFLSQYKNLTHAWFHRSAREDASTFWTGCGAMRREVFLEFGGFEERYDHPTCEDIELGYRLRLAGHRIRLDRELLVKHLKRWTFWNLVATDIFKRAGPWTEMILRHRFMPNDLNLETRQRLSVAVALALLAASAALPLVPHARILAACALLFAAHTALNLRLLRFLAKRRGLGFAAAAAPLNLLSHIYSGVTFGVCLLLHPLRRLTAGYLGRYAQTGPF